MAVEVSIESSMLVHESGTKFYEVVQLYNVAAKRFVLVRRWGKLNSSLLGGGEAKVETFADVRKCQDAASKIVREKGGRGYEKRPPQIPLTEANVPDSEQAAEVLRPILRKSFDGELILNVAGQLGFSETAFAAPKVEMRTPPEVEVVRDADWGSW